MDTSAVAAPTAVGVPVELLVKIFMLRIQHPMSLVSLAAVCRRWRDIIYDEPLLWTHFNVHLGTTTTQMRRQLGLCKDVAITVDINLLPSIIDDELREVLKLVLDEYGRIEHLNVDVTQTSLNDADPFEDPPPELAPYLSSSLVWSHLKSFVLSAQDPSDVQMQIDMAAPALERLNLSCVYVGSWHRMGLESSIRNIELSGVTDLGDLFVALPYFSRIRRLSLDDDSRSEETLESAIPPAPANLVITLVEFSLFWTKVDFVSFLQVLGLFPRLEELFVSTHFVYDPEPNDGTRLRANFQLPHLISLRIFCKRDMQEHILHALAPALRDAKLQTLRLENVHVASLDAFVGSPLETLSLQRVACDASILWQALQQCRGLCSLRLIDPDVTSWDDQSFDTQLILPDLAFGQLYLTPPTQSVSPRPSWHARLLKDFLSLLPTPGIPQLYISGIPIPPVETPRALAGTLTGESLLLNLSIRNDTTIILVKAQPPKATSTHQIGCSFEVTSLLDSLHVLQTSTFRSLLSAITVLEIDLQRTADFFRALPPHPTLLSLSQITISARLASWNDSPPRDAFDMFLRTVIDSRVQTDGAILCPRLKRVIFQKPYRGFDMRVSNTLLARFLGLFQSQLEVEMDTDDMLVEVDESRESARQARRCSLRHCVLIGADCSYRRMMRTCASRSMNSLPPRASAIKFR